MGLDGACWRAWQSTGAGLIERPNRPDLEDAATLVPEPVQFSRGFKANLAKDLVEMGENTTPLHGPTWLTSFLRIIMEILVQ